MMQRRVRERAAGNGHGQVEVEMTEYDPMSLRRAIGELERWAAEFVFWFKPQRLPLPLITIQGGGQNALGWFAWSRWECRDGAILDEINFVPEYLGRDVFDIA